MKYVEKLKQERESLLNTGMQTGMQRMADLVAVALNESAVMGRACWAPVG